MRPRTLVIGTAAAALLSAVLQAPVGAAPTAPVATVAGATEMVVHEVRASSPDESPAALGARLAAAGLDVVGRDSESIFVLGPDGTTDLITAAGDVIVVGTSAAPVGGVDAAPDDQDAILPRRLHGRAYETFYGGYRTVDAYTEFEDDLVEEYPELVEVVEYGESWGGQPLRAVCVTADADTASGCDMDPDVDKARFLIVAQTHSRELSTSELTWRLITDLVDGYGRDARVTGLLDGTEVWLVPHVNPDGTETVQRGITEQGTGQSSPAWHRKNMNDTYSATACSGTYAGSQEGVDINRNFDVDWGRVGTSKVPCNLTYGGPEAASEPETTAQTDLMQALFRDQRGEGMEAEAPRSTTGAMLTLHSYSDVVLLPWGFTTDGTLAPNDEGLRSYAFRMSEYNGYVTGTSEEVLYASSGATEDWAYADLGIAGYTFEVGPGGGTCGGFFPAYSCQDGFWAENGPAFLYGAEGARQPYALSLGPTTTSPKARAKGGKTTVRATASDDAYGVGVDRPDVQDVTAARIFVGKAPWAGGKADKLKVVGSSDTVTIKGKVKAPTKKTIAYVQAKDASGEWGPVAPVWLKPAKAA